MAVLVGVVAGLGAIMFRALIAFFHNLLFLGRLSLAYDARVHTPPSPWGPLVILVPVVGAAGVVFVVKHFAPEAKGTGVPEVIDAIYYRRGKIRPAVAFFKAIASSLSIGSGAPVGREGPIIQIGSTFGSLIGQFLAMTDEQRVTLIAAGAGGGIAATFNTPLGGILFAFEVMIHEVNVRTLVPIALSSVTATYLARLVFGAHPAFMVPAFQSLTFQAMDLATMVAFALLGLLLGLVSAGFIKSVVGLEDFFEKRVRGSYYLRHMAAMLVVGVMFYLLLIKQGHYYVEGVGYAAVQDLLSSAAPALGLLVVLFVLKWLATALSLGSGASGGIFSPMLYMGAMLGGAYGLVVRHFFPGLTPNPALFAVAGMAGLVGGATGAAIASIVMLFEMTLDYSIIVPVTATVTLSYAVRKGLLSESMYTVKLARRGHNIPEAMEAYLEFQSEARQMMDSHFLTVPASTPLDEFADQTLPAHATIATFLVEEGERIVGALSRQAVLAALEQSPADAPPLGTVADRNFVVVGGDSHLLEVIAAMRDSNSTVALVSSQGKPPTVDSVEGLITKERLTHFVAEAAEWFED